MSTLSVRSETRAYGRAALLTRGALALLLGVGLALAASPPPAHAAATGVGGTVTGPSGAPAPGVTVNALRLEGGGFVSDAERVTEGDGTYSFTELTPGEEYILGFTDKTGGSPVEYWKDVHAPELATRFTVVADTVLTRDAQLDVGRHIRGRVTGPDGAALAGVVVNAYSVAPASEIQFASTDADGRYELSRLPAGTYKLGFFVGGNAVEYWTDKADFASADLVDVTGADANERNVVLGGPDRAAEPVPAVANTARPTISGKARVGKKLRAGGGSWTPASVTLSYQWLAKGKPIRGATGPVLKLKGSSVGKKITVQVTATAPGRPAATALSAATKKVKPRRS